MNDAFEGMNCHAYPGQYQITAMPNNLNKCIAMENILDTCKQSRFFLQFLFIAGNDRSDECLFDKANQLANAQEIGEIITVNVTACQTAAR